MVFIERVNGETIFCLTFTKEPHTQHTTFPVGCSIIDETPWKLANGGGLSSVSPTILQLMGLEQPSEMHGKSLLLEPINL